MPTNNCIQYTSISITVLFAVFLAIEPGQVKKTYLVLYLMVVLSFAVHFSSPMVWLLVMTERLG